MESVVYSNKEFEQILQELQRMMDDAEQLADPVAKEMVRSILDYFEMMHKEPLTRLMNVIESDHPELRAKLETDYTIKTLFSLYDLIEGEIERNPMENPNTKGFIPVDEVGILSSITKLRNDEM